MLIVRPTRVRVKCNVCGTTSFGAEIPKIAKPGFTATSKAIASALDLGWYVVGDNATCPECLSKPGARKPFRDDPPPAAAPDDLQTAHYAALQTESQAAFARAREEEEAQQLTPTGTTCSVCGEPQFSSPSGVACTNGHGGAPAYDPESEETQLVSPEAWSRVVAEALKLPTAEQEAAADIDWLLSSLTVPDLPPAPTYEVRLPPGMTFTAGQRLAADRIGYRLKHSGILRIKGFAGTGKSVMLAATVDLLESIGRAFIVLTPTGKAASRLRQLQIPAGTIHSWLYIPCVDSDGNLAGFRPRDIDDIPGNFVLLVDEASMVGPTVWRDLIGAVGSLSPGRCVLLFGDGYQLPPILSGDDKALYPNGFSLLDDLSVDFDDTVEMTDVVRQAGGNPILVAATALRSNEIAPRPDGIALSVSRNSGIAAAEREILAAEADPDSVFLTWTNKDRHHLNNVVRRKRGWTGQALVVGETLISLINNAEHGLANGDLLTVTDLEPAGARSQARVPDYAHLSCRWIEVRTPTGETVVVPLILIGPDDDAQKIGFYVRRNAKWLSDPLIVDYGYCLTVHKSQGSEWSRVGIYAPEFLASRMAAEDAKRWLYTAITRARKTCSYTGAASLAYQIGG